MNRLTHRFFDEVEKAELPFVPVTKSLLPFLQNILSNTHSPDYMAQSAAYYAITGRKGLFLYGDDKTAMLLAFHPNKDNVLLLFPPFGQHPTSLLKQLLAESFLPDCELQLARIPLDDHLFCQRLQTLGIKEFDHEDVLDWFFPVHVVSTQDVVQRQGKDFNNLRGHVNKAFRAGLRSEVIDLSLHEKDLLNTLDTWTKSVDKPGFTINDLKGPTIKAIELIKADALSINGIIIYGKSNDPVGFWIWDEALKDKSMALSLVRVSTGKKMGAAEFAGLKVCEILSAAQIEKFCFGGSEIKSLDDFRKKFNPVESVNLASKSNLQDLDL